MMATSRGITETKIYDRDAVVDRYGIPPEPIPDFYGLKGDTCDNIPGVPGIGDKTASDLLQQFGDLETVLAEHRRDLRRQAQGEPEQPRRGRAHVEDLATVQRDVPVEVDLTAVAAGEPDRARLREIFREFELRDPLRRLEEALRRRRRGGAAHRARGGDRRVSRAPCSRPGWPRCRRPAALAAARPAAEEGQLPGMAEDGPLRFAAYAGGADVLAGEAEGSERWSPPGATGR